MLVVEYAILQPITRKADERSVIRRMLSGHDSEQLALKSRGLTNSRLLGCGPQNGG